MKGWSNCGFERKLAERLEAAARLLPPPPVDAARLARTAVLRGRAARVERPLVRLPLWSTALAMLVAVLSAALLLRRPPPPQQAADDLHEPVARLVNDAVAWAEGMLGGRMLEDELRLLIRDAGRLSAAVADDMHALYPEAAPLTGRSP